MQPKNIVPTMTRRAFGKFVAVSIGAGVAFTQRTNGFARSRPNDRSAVKVYSFYPQEKGVITTCNACLSHARYKRFATAAAAEENRAHHGCNCAILETSESVKNFVRMFGGTGKSVDRLVYDSRQSPTT
jgi:superfamily II helicase